MRGFVLSILAILFFCTVSNAAQLLINVGTASNDGTGDTLRQAFQKANTNFTSLFAGMGGGTNIVTATNIVVGTNVLYFTNECYVSFGPDTNNTVSISNAGLAAVNGIYRTNMLNGYTQGVYKLAYSPSYTGWVISNATAEVYGRASLSGTLDEGEAGQLWADDFLANPPAPRSWWGPITNCFTVLASSSELAMPQISSNLYVSAERGNDTNALRGRIDRPWRNIQPALRASQRGDTIYFGPGQYARTDPALGILFPLTNNVNLIGSGRGLTILGTMGLADASLDMETGATARDFTIWGRVRIGPSVNASNCLVSDCEAIDTLNGVEVKHLGGQFTILNSKLVSAADGLLDSDTAPGGSNRVIRIGNCDILCTNGTVPRGINGGDTRIEMFGGSIEATGGSIANNCVFLSTTGSRTNKTGSILLSNVRLRHSSASGSLQVSNINNLPIFLDNCTAEAFAPNLVNGSFTNGWEHRDIAFPNGAARTNRLVDTRSLTNALVAASEQGHRVTITDDGRTASGTNVYIYPSAGQTILGQTWTNITTDGGSLTLMIRGTNWVPVAKFP